MSRPELFPEEKLVVGKATTFKQAFIRLPSDDFLSQRGHTEDVYQLLEELHNLRCVLASTIEPSNSTPALKDRITTLHSSSVHEMEQLSFKRGVVLAQAGWSAIPYNHSWGEIFSYDDEYFRWRISEMQPQPAPEISSMLLVCIQTNKSVSVDTSLDDIDDDSSLYLICLLDKHELASLISVITERDLA